MSFSDYHDLGWQETLVLASALRLGLLEAVREPSGSEAVADGLGLDSRAVGAVLGALAELGVLERVDEAYVLGEEHREPLLNPEHPDYAGALVLDRPEQISAWSRLPEVLRDGGPVRDRTASSGVAGEGVTEEFIHRMRREAEPDARETAHSLLSRLPDRVSILDVGGGPGAVAEALARGGARVTVFDLPEVVDLVRERLSGAGVSVEPGDMNETLPDGPFDAVYLGHTSHLYGPRENRELFRRLYHSLASGGLLAIRDFVRGESREAALFAVNMLFFTPRGGTYTAAEYRRWFTEAGFRGFELARVPGRDTHLALGRKPEGG